jgi:hypothetical protein
MEEQQPKGLSKSLDDIISEQRKNNRGGGTGNGKSNRGKDRRRERNSHDRGKDNMLTDHVFRIRGGTQKSTNHRRGRSRRNEFSHRGNRLDRDHDDMDGSAERHRQRSGFRDQQQRSRGRQTFSGSRNSQPRMAGVGLTHEWNNQDVLLIKLNGSETVQIAPNGDVSLKLTGDSANRTLLINTINFILYPINVKIIMKENSTDLQVSDGHSLVRFQDGLVLRGKGMSAMPFQRAMAVMQVISPEDGIHHKQGFGQWY